jgi:hypothetical protein
MPSEDHCTYPPPNESLPRFIWTNGDELATNEFSPAGDTSQPSKGVIGYNEHDWQDKPEQSVVNIVHDILELSNREAKYEDGPAQLIDLKADVTRLNC